MPLTLAKYDWTPIGRGNRKTDDPLLDGGTYLLKPGEDFDGDVKRYRDHLRSKAARAGYKLRTEITEDRCLVVQGMPMAR